MAELRREGDSSLGKTGSTEVETWKKYSYESVDTLKKLINDINSHTIKVAAGEVVSPDVRVEFDESMLMTESQLSYRGLYLAGRIYLDDNIDLVLRNYGIGRGGFLYCGKDNGIALNNKKNCCYIGIIVHLIDAGILIGEGNPITRLTYEDYFVVSKRIIAISKHVARLVMTVALHAFIQGFRDDGKLNLYESFSDVMGNFISEARLVTLVKAIMTEGTLDKILAIITVGEVVDQNINGFTVKFKKLSTPDLVKKAMSLDGWEKVASWFDGDALLAYRRFDEGGVLAQIASGPLGPFCMGKINPLKVKVNSIPHNVTLNQLCRIEAPYHEATIRKVYMILEATGSRLDGWDQGRKAMANMGREDHAFKAICKSIWEMKCC